MNISEYFYHKGKDGVTYKVWTELSSSSEDDWEAFLDLCVRGFYNDPEMIIDCPAEKKRSKYLKDLFNWEFKCSGMTAQGPGGLVCVKAAPIEKPECPRVIGGTCVSAYWDDEACPFPSSNQTNKEKLLKKMAWEEENIYNVVVQVAAEFDTIEFYWPYHVIDENFQGCGLGRKLFRPLMKTLIKEQIDTAERVRGRPLTSLPIGFGLCTNHRTIKFAMNFLDEITVAHLVYPEGSKKNDYWVTLSEPYDDKIRKRLETLFLLKKNKRKSKL